jgi:hypothetical protein
MARLRLAHTLAFWVLSLTLWLVPFFVSGWTGRTWGWLPKALSFQHNAAGLFTRKIGVWWDHHIEGQRPDGMRFQMDEWSIFPTGAFGFRTKYDRILNESSSSRAAKRIRLRVAEHVMERWQAIGQRKEDLVAIRLVRSAWKAGTPEMSQPAGFWSPPDVTKLPQDKRVLLGGYSMSESRVRPFWQEGDPLPKELLKNPATVPGNSQPTVGERVTLPRAGTQPPPARKLVPTAQILPPKSAFPASAGTEGRREESHLESSN